MTENNPEKQNIVELRTVTLLANETRVWTFDPVPDVIVMAQLDINGDIIVQYGATSLAVGERVLRLAGRMSARLPGREALTVTAATNSTVTMMILTNLEGDIRT